MASTTEPNMIDDTLLEAEEKMDKAVSVAKEDFSIIRTGRAHPGMFSKVTVDYYGSPTPVNQLASFHVPEPRMIVIQPFDKGSLGAIERAIRNSDLGVNPANDGLLIRIVLPELSEERRRERPGRDQEHQAPRQGPAGQAEQGGRRGRGRRPPCRARARRADAHL